MKIRQQQQFIRIANELPVHSHYSARIAGGKAYGLLRMAAAGIRVPPGFVMGTACSREFYENNNKIGDATRQEVEEHMHWLEKTTGRSFGSRRKPLLVSVRSGARGGTGRGKPGGVRVPGVGCAARRLPRRGLCGARAIRDADSVVAFSGEARFKKGLPLLQALAEEMARRARGTLLLIGGVRDEERRDFDAWRSEHPAAATRVREIPYRSDPAALPELYAQVDLAVFPSFFDGMPNALLESCACGVPALVSAAGGNVDVIRDGETGFILPLRALDTFPVRVFELLDDPDRLALIGTAAREHVVRDHAPEDETRRLVEIYRTLVRGGAD